MSLLKTEKILNKSLSAGAAVKASSPLKRMVIKWVKRDEKAELLVAETGNCRARTYE